MDTYELKNLKVREELQSDIISHTNQILYLINNHSSKIASKLYQEAKKSEDGESL